MEYVIEMISRYKTKGLLIDTNLLLLYVVGMYDPDRIQRFKRTMAFTVDEFLLLGMYDPDRIQRFKRTMAFTVDEFLLLATIFESFDKIITTPNVLTEVSNLSGQLPKNLHSYFYSDFAARIPVLEERYTASGTISASSHFNKFGLTDSGIVDTVKDSYLVLTDDLMLFGYLQNLGIDAINFNHIRQLAW